MSKLEGLLLDIDGTLIDSNDTHAKVWQEAFAHFGKDVPFDVVRSQIGKGGDLLVPDLLNAREMRTFGEKLQKYRKEIFRKNYMHALEPFPNVRGNLEALKARGIKLALASSAAKDEVKFYVELMDAADLLEGTTSADDAEYSKPSPEIFEAALEKLGTHPSRTATVGDTPYDILASHRIALPSVALRCGGFEEDLLKKAEFLFDNFEELVVRIDEVDQYFAHE